jgi:hypothetical protein
VAVSHRIAARKSTLVREIFTGTSRTVFGGEAAVLPERGTAVPCGIIGHHPAIFEHRPVGTARDKAYVHGTLAPQPRQNLLEEIVVDEPYLLQTAVL